MTDQKRRTLLKHMIAGTAALATSQASAMSQVPEPSPEPVAPVFPQNVEPWGVGGNLPREGMQPPADFDFPVRTFLPFAHGVSSGDPLPDRVMLWTRITLVDPVPGEVSGLWRIALDPLMKQVVKSGIFTTDDTKDWTVHIDVAGLEPYAQYYYQFFHDGAESCVGRTRTAPETGQSLDNLRIAVAACASYFSGHMNGYGRMADRKDIDLVVHCGDYVYNSPDLDEQIRVPHNNPNQEQNQDYRDPKTLNEARRRYALYRSDPDLFRAHQQHPFVIIWDNHDLSMGSTRTEGYQAFWEWTASRRPDIDDIARGHRTLKYGSMADLIVIDRHYAKNFESERQNSNEAFLGTSQNQWLRDELIQSKERQSHWRLILNQVFLGQLHLINPPSGIDWVIEKLFSGYSDGVILNDSQWDGYPEEREALFKFMRQQQITNNIVFTGDMHMNWGSDLNEDPNSPINYDRFTGRGSVGVEFAPSSISRGGADETIKAAIGGDKNPVADTTAKIGADIASAAILAGNGNARYMEWKEHGYGIADITVEKATFEYWWTPITVQSTHERLGQQLISQNGHDHLETVNNPQSTSQVRPKDGDFAPEVSEAFLLIFG